MKNKPTGVFTPARGITAVGGLGIEGYAPLEMRPGGMLVQKRNSDADHGSVVVPTIKVKVKHGSSYLEFNISSQASFGNYLSFILLVLDFLHALFSYLPLILLIMQVI